MNFAGKVALVTGDSSGIGRAAAIALGDGIPFSSPPYAGTGNRDSRALFHPSFYVAVDLAEFFLLLPMGIL